MDTALAEKRALELRALEDENAHDQKLRALAYQRWQNEREHSSLILMDQIPKLIGAACLGALLGYIIPLKAQ